MIYDTKQILKAYAFLIKHVFLSFDKEIIETFAFSWDSIIEYAKFANKPEWLVLHDYENDELIQNFKLAIWTSNAKNKIAKSIEEVYLLNHVQIWDTCYWETWLHYYNHKWDESWNNLMKLCDLKDHFNEEELQLIFDVFHEEKEKRILEVTLKRYRRFDSYMKTKPDSWKTKEFREWEKKIRQSSVNNYTLFNWIYHKIILAANLYCKIEWKEKFNFEKQNILIILKEYWLEKAMSYRWLNFSYMYWWLLMDKTDFELEYDWWSICLHDKRIIYKAFWLEVPKEDRM